MSTTIELTPREKDVYKLMSEGLRPCEIVSRLRINKASVRRYKARVLVKLRRVAIYSENQPGVTVTVTQTSKGSE